MDVLIPYQPPSPSGNAVRAWLVLAVSALLLLCGCKPASTVVPPPTAIPVTVKVLTTQHIRDMVILDGTIAPSQQVNLIARVAGNLDAVHFKDGQWVKKGDLLFTIERLPYLDQLKLNQARLDQTRSDYERQKELLKENANSETNVEISLSNLRQAEANFDIAKTNLSYTEVRAPFDGVMGKHQVDPGNYVGATAGGTVLGTLIQIEPVFVNAAVGENEAIRIRAKQAALKKDIVKGLSKTVVHAQLQGESEPSETGVLDFIDHQLNQTSGTVAVRGLFANQSRHLIPGFYARLSIEASAGRNALVLPKSAVQTDQQGDYVYTAGNDGSAHRTAIHTALLPHEEVEVTEGLKPGDKVVTEGYARLSDGHAIQILAQAAPSAVAAGARP